jgi:MFS family permease
VVRNLLGYYASHIVCLPFHKLFLAAWCRFHVLAADQVIATATRLRFPAFCCFCHGAAQTGGDLAMSLPASGASVRQDKPTPRHFVLFSVGHCVSSIGFWAQKTGIGWLTWELTHSVAWVGTIAMADLVATLWVAPLAGAVVDRNNPYRLFSLTQTLTLLLALLLCVVTAAGVVSIHGLLLFAVVESTLQGFNQPVRMLLTGLLAPHERLSQAIAANSIAVAVARSLGPASAGVIMYFGPVALVFALNAVSFLAILGIVFHLRRWLDRPPLTRSIALAGDIAEGFRYVARTPEIASVIFLAFVFAFLARPFSELFPAFAGEVFGGGLEVLSILMTVQGLGALFGALWMLRRHDSRGLARNILSLLQNSAKLGSEQG